VQTMCALGRSSEDLFRLHITFAQNAVHIQTLYIGSLRLLPGHGYNISAYSHT